LDYALSYDENNAAALCLYGRIYSEQLPRYALAIDYFRQALAADLHAVEVYPFFIQTLLLNEDIEEAQKLIDFALSVKGINKIEILLKRAQLEEIGNKFEDVRATLAQIEALAINDFYDDLITETKKRVDKKMGKADANKKKKKK
jgi:tetratricopeptide (TPR) repeat protein